MTSTPRVPAAAARTSRKAADVLSALSTEPLGRIPVTDVEPVVDDGKRPAKSVVGEEFTVSATVFREGHDAVNATVVMKRPDKSRVYIPMTCVDPGIMRWEARVHADTEGMWTYRVEAWSDPFSTWLHDATIKVEAGVDVELMLEEGARVLQRTLKVPGRTPEDAKTIEFAIHGLRDATRTAAERLAAGSTDKIRRIMRNAPLRDLVTRSPKRHLWVERERALYGAWYEIFPRSEGARYDESTGQWKTGNLRTAAERLPAIASMGFDVVYLTPIHPIGHTNRKGKNNSLTCEPGDPGSPYAIGNEHGGYDAIEPSLGTFDDFDHFMERAKNQGLEVALDIALNCSPDHPWVKEHPEWFTTRADGTIAYAENPPKKYQDIYPLNFDNDRKGIYKAVRDAIQVWLDHGVRIFRVDNPHTKPVEFWQWLIADVAADYPDTIWLAEAFTKPPMMHTLAKVGFQQSYTYYAWRNSAAELREYVTELASETGHFLRPTFWPTTHDILTPYMQFGGPTAFKLRAALAATLVPTYGIYAGYEHCEHVARQGAEEHVDNEKYEFKNRRWDLDTPTGGTGEAAGRPNLAPWLTMLNTIRSHHPSLHRLRNITFHRADDDNFLVFSKRSDSTSAYGIEDVILVVANTDPHTTRETMVHLDLQALGMERGTPFIAHDLVTGSTWTWDESNYVRLGPDHEPVHILHVRRF